MASAAEMHLIVHLATVSQPVPPSRVDSVVYPVSEDFTFWVIQFEIPVL